MARIIIDGFKDEFIHIKYGIRSFSRDKVAGIGAILSLLTVLTSLAVFVILIAQYAMGGGYDDLQSFFSLESNAVSYYQAPFLPILAGLNLALLITAYIKYFKNEKVGFRILGAIPFIVCIGCIVCYYAVLILLKMRFIRKLDDSEKFIMILGAAVLASALLSIILLLVREKDMSFSCLRMVIFSFGLAPLITLCAEDGAVLGILIIAVVVLSIATSKSGGDSHLARESVTQTRNNPAPTKPSGPNLREQEIAIVEINRKYREGCQRICDSDPNYTGLTMTDNCARQIAALRKQLEAEAEARGVKGKVSIY